MKETNMEHFRSEIEKNDYSIALVNGEIKRCSKMRTCDECDFEMVGCSTRKIKWLMSEYKAEPVLTQREKGFVECVDDGWIARDKDDYLHWFEEKPTKGEDWWEYCCNESSCAMLRERYFPFITWEDEEPWSVESLRKLKVCNETD